MMTLHNFLDTCEDTDIRIRLAYDDGHYISKDKEAVMSATKRFVEDKIEEFAVKYSIGYDDLMKAYNAMNEIGIKCDFNNFEKKLIRFYHYAQALKLLEDDI